MDTSLMKQRAFLQIIAAGILWGTSGIFVKFLAPYGFSSLHMTALRGCISFLCMALYAFFRDRKLFRVKLSELILFAFIGAALFGTASSYYAAMQATSISTAVVLMYSAPIYVAVFSVVFLGEKMSQLKFVSLACMLIGCCFVSGLIGGLKFDLVGILLGILSGIIYGAYNVLTKISLRRNCSPISATLYSFLFMSVIALAVSHPQQIVGIISSDPVFTLPLVLGLGIFTFVLPYFLYTLALKVLPAGTASALSIVEPMAATVFSVVFFQEKLTFFPLLGIVLILLAVFLLSKAESE